MLLNMAQTSLSESAIAEAKRLSLEAICQEDEAAQSRLFAEAREILHNVLSGEPNNPRLHHLLGLCWYDAPARSDKIRQAIEFHLLPSKDAPPIAVGLGGEEFETVCELKGLALRRAYGDCLRVPEIKR
jgi:hypothetical protein